MLSFVASPSIRIIRTSTRHSHSKPFNTSHGQCCAIRNEVVRSSSGERGHLHYCYLTYHHLLYTPFRNQDNAGLFLALKNGWGSANGLTNTVLFGRGHHGGVARSVGMLTYAAGAELSSPAAVGQSSADLVLNQTKIHCCGERHRPLPPELRNFSSSSYHSLLARTRCEEVKVCDDEYNSLLSGGRFGVDLTNCGRLSITPLQQQM